MKTLYKDFCPQQKARFLSALTVLLALVITSPVYANPPSCAYIFQNGLQTNRGDGYIRFNYDSQLINPSSSALLTRFVMTNPSSSILSCGGEHCIEAGSEGPRLYAAPFKTTTSTEFVTAPKHMKIILGQSTNQFSTVDIYEWGTGEFSAAHDEYIIGTLKMSYRSTLRLRAGNYWIKTLKLETEGRIDVSGEGTVNLFVESPITLPLNFKINERSKNPAKFAIYSYSDLKFYVGSKTYAFAHIENSATLHYKAAVVGGIIARNLDLQEQSQVRYDATAAQALNFGSLCRSL